LLLQLPLFLFCSVFTQWFVGFAAPRFVSTITIRENYSKCQSIAGSSIVVIPFAFKELMADNELLNKQFDTYMNTTFFAEPQNS